MDRDKHMEKQLVRSGNIDLAVYSWGSAPTPDQPRQVVVLVHGFPDRASLWAQTAQHLQNDHYVVAFDMRGCGDSTPVKGLRHYRYAELLKDLYAVIDAVSPHQKVHLVGHDWGGLYGWEAICSSEGEKRIASFTTMAPSLEHVGLFLQRRLLRPTPRNLLQMFDQLRRNALMMFFTLPLLPELVWRAGIGVWLMRRMVEGSEGIGYTKNEGVEGDAIRYLGIYRANLLQRTLIPRRMVSKVPVHAVLAVRDPFLPPSVFEQCGDSTDNYTTSEIPASHWAPLSCHQALAGTISLMSRQHAAPWVTSAP